MGRLCITLLGAYRATLDGESLTAFGTDKARALLAYLAVENHRPHRREHLAGLLWSDQPERKALHSLRQSISTLRKILKDSDSDHPFLLVNRESVQFNPGSNYWLDIVEFRALVDQGLPPNRFNRTDRSANIRRLQYALQLYRGNFLDQLVLRGSPLFDEWAILQRESLTRQIISVMTILVDYHELRGEFEPACKIAEQIVALIPWEEKSHQVIIRMLAKGGHWSAAEVQYHNLQRYLGEELGVSPSSETQSLIDTIRNCARQDIPFEPQKPIIQSNLPYRTTTFVGRKNEIDELWDYLVNPKYRLITLTGPGGIGKSRLALKVARDFVSIFKDGVYFVPLTTIKSDELLPISIAEAIGFTFYAPEDPLKLLIDHLRNKDMLLVLDNVEHLLAPSNHLIDVLTKILGDAHGIVILATSRQPLDLRAEQIIEVRGLTYPSQEEITRSGFFDEIVTYSGFLLFEQIAKRINPKFSLEKNINHVVRICQLVEGAPLGIELSATWMRGYSANEIARQIEQDFDFLATSMKDVPDRHRSLRSVFNHSWQLLKDNEKSILRKLTVFRGGFSLAAAETISGATANNIHALNDKSLLNKVEDGRFDMQNLIWQFAVEKLTDNPTDYQDTRDSHCTYFATYIQNQEKNLLGLKPVTAQKNISLEIENIRASWQWATENHRIEILTQSARGLGRFFDMRSWFREGREVFSTTRNTLQEIPNLDKKMLQIRGVIAAQLGWFEVQLGNYHSAISILSNSIITLRDLESPSELVTSLNVLGSAVFELGELETAKSHFEESLIIAAQEGYIPDIAFANNYLGSIARNQGDFPQSKLFYTESLKQYQKIGDLWGIAIVLNNLGNMAGISGEYSDAERFFEKSLDIRRELDDQAGVAGCLQNLSIIAFLEEDYTKANTLRQECLSICLEIGFTWGIASTLKHLGDVDKAMGDLPKARQRYTESLAMSEQSEDRRSVAFTLNSLAGLELLQEEYHQASDYYKKALKIATEIDVVPLVIDILMGIADLWIKESCYKDALELITFALNHPGTETQTKNRGIQLRKEMETQLSPIEIQQYLEQYQPKPFNSIVNDIISNKSD